MKKIDRCRICGSTALLPVIDLGEICITSAFPWPDEPDPAPAPLHMVRCDENAGCGLVQLLHSVDPDIMFGQNDYGYRSGINHTMREHLRGIAAEALDRVPLAAGDTVLDIGSNDGTLLGHYRAPGIQLVGIDPTADQFAEHYSSGALRVPRLFTREAFTDAVGTGKARIVTSIAMLYDLEDPAAFVSDVRDCLAPDGIWIAEQSYLPLMMERTAYDSICHEHLEYYRLHQIEWLLERAGLRLLDVRLNDMNGGSFRFTACHRDASHRADDAAVASIRAAERDACFGKDAVYLMFAAAVVAHRTKLREVLDRFRRENRAVHAYGASTKGNVILSYCGLDHTWIAAAADRNTRKVGRVTPGTRIPIVSEADSRAVEPAAFLALPWFFEEEFVARERDFLDRGGEFIFPLPHVRSISRAKKVTA